VPVSSENGDLINLAIVQIEIGGSDAEVIRRRGGWGCGIGGCTCTGTNSDTSDVPSPIETAAFRDGSSAWVTSDHHLAGQLRVHTPEVENENAVDEDEEIVVSKELECEAGGAVIDEEVARLGGEVGVILDAGNCRDPAATAQRTRGRAI
jgi:hypothetical protein